MVIEVIEIKCRFNLCRFCLCCVVHVMSCIFYFSFLSAFQGFSYVLKNAIMFCAFILATWINVWQLCYISYIVLLFMFYFCIMPVYMGICESLFLLVQNAFVWYIWVFVWSIKLPMAYLISFWWCQRGKSICEMKLGCIYTRGAFMKRQNSSSQVFLS